LSSFDIIVYACQNLVVIICHVNYAIVFACKICYEAFKDQIGLTMGRRWNEEENFNGVPQQPREVGLGMLQCKGYHPICSVSEIPNHLEGETLQ
jgi:hypothetical protein